MTIQPGQMLLHYRLVEKIGEGGMGVVWKAVDTKLGREVAIKVLPESFSRDPERLARFKREAKAVAALNHPNIVTLHSVEDSGSVNWITMELVQGKTLTELIPRNGVPLGKFFELAVALADAIAAAHRQGITHRDLKPDNVMVSEDGRLKVLDFGLAKLREEVGASDQGTQLPTATMTQEGRILGTVSYMSPEQAEGKPIDHRSDIFSLGVMLYQMATGRRPFQGETSASIVSSILKDTPAAVTELKPSLPRHLGRIVKRCLAKEPALRFQSSLDLRNDLAGLDQELSSGEVEFVEVEARPSGGRRAWWIAAVAVVIAAIAGFASWGPWRETAPGSRIVKRFTIDLPPAESLWLGLDHFFQRPGLALSPSGERLVYVVQRDGSPQLVLREMDRFEAEPIPGTDGARNPFFSPDGEWVAFLTESELRKVSLSSGALFTICEVIPGVSTGGSWGDDGNILFSLSPNHGLARVSSDGGSPEQLTSPDPGRGDKGHKYPTVLPGSRAALFTIRESGGLSEMSIGVLSFQTGEWRTLIEGGTSPHYLPSGHLVYAKAGALLAVPFDTERLELTGSPVRVLEGVVTMMAAEFSLSADGSLAYVPGTGTWPRFQLAWVDRQGRMEALPLPQHSYRCPRLSPDGRRLACTIIDQQTGNADVWVCGLSPPWTRLTFFPGYDGMPIWSRDGEYVAFSSSDPRSPPNLSWKPAYGTGVAETLAVMTHAQFPTSWSPDGRFLLFADEQLETKLDIGLLPIGDKSEPELLVETAFNETAGAFSPDGRWIAYQSDESGRYEIYVRPFRGPGSEKQVSTQGGTEPVWAPGGGELFYRHGDKMMAVAVITEPEFVAAEPESLFEGQYAPGRIAAAYDVSADGQQFLMISGDQLASTRIHIVLNWQSELERLVPTGAN